MRVLVCIAAMVAAGLAASSPAAAQSAPAAKKPAAKAATAKPRPAAPNPAETAALKESYAAMPLAERLAIQSDLVWSGDYNGIINGDFGDRSIAAVKAFQKKSKSKETGILTPDERALLAASVRVQREQVGWTLVEDEALPGARLGIPAKFAVKSERGTSGSRWFSARGEIQIETFREKMGGAQLSTLFEEMKKTPAGRRVEYNTINADFFVLSGLQGLKKFYVRVQLKDNEARGMTILYDQAMDGIMEPVVVAMSSAFAPFGGETAAAAGRKVEYASGIIVSNDGHVITERQATDGCHVIVVAGHGNAERIAEDKSSDLALLRLHGAANIRPLSLSAEPPRGADLILLGVSEPQAQGGGNAVAATKARLRGVDGARVLLDAAPSAGFAGAAAFDTQNQFVGVVDLNPGSIVPAASVRAFLEAANVTPTTGRADIEAAKAAIARVICVRK
jgi:hypothetical protein